MSFEKRNYVAYDTTITALNLNNIQDQIIRNEQELTALNNGYKSNLNLINSKADINHADTTEKYGLGSPDYYGHNKALNYSQAISANNKLDGLCPSIQAFQTLDNNVKNLEKELDSGLVGILKVSSSKEFPACYKIKGTDVWINPPMIPNEEYLTFEYFGGLQVYTQLVVFSENDAIKEHENDVQLKYTWNNKDDIIFITRMCGRAGGYTLYLSSSEKFVP